MLASTAISLSIQFCLILFLLFWNIAFANQAIPSSYDFKFITNQWLTMPDGVKLSINYWQPQSNNSKEKFPIVLEVLPYRKDDIHYLADYSIGAYFARRGIGFARVDIRGTGSSQGKIPDREYSDQELADIQDAIKQLAKLSWSNGNIGMQGISWSAFNSIMTAMQRPQHLKGILVAHGSDDLYANDIHNIDGVLHLDIFTIEIETDNLLPASPAYQINQDYFTNRFDQKPWIFNYLKHQRDSKFWENKRSLRTNYAAINIPVYAFASLLDGYRDYAINMLEHLKSPLRVAIGPQIHAWPDGTPGPHYEWREVAVRFWQQVLNGKNMGIWQTPKFTFFMRNTVPPNPNLSMTPGSYYTSEWPVANSSKQFILQDKGKLATKIEKPITNTLAYQPSAGRGVLNWWGESTPDMRTADKGNLIYDSEPLSENLYVLGNPKVTLMVSANAPLAHWVVRLEDVNPDGKVSFVTGALRNGAERESRIQPKPLISKQSFSLTFPLHFTTWTFAKGHRIRIAVSNSQFPMIWPSPYKMSTTLRVGDGASQMILPLVKLNKKAKPGLISPKLNEVPHDAKDVARMDLTPFKISKDKSGNIIATAKEGYTLNIRQNILKATYKVIYKVNDLNPAKAFFQGEGEDSIHMIKENRLVTVQALIRVQSDAKYFHTTVVHKIFENNKLVRVRKWHESILRDFQ